MLINLVKKLCLILLVAYKKIASPLLPGRCRFYPTCSEYAMECIDTYSLPVAAVKICGRLLRCHPFHPGGVDLP